jgi:hypothetical protein
MELRRAGGTFGKQCGSQGPTHGGEWEHLSETAQVIGPQNKRPRTDSVERKEELTLSKTLWLLCHSKSLYLHSKE